MQARASGLRDLAEGGVRRLTLSRRPSNDPDPWGVNLVGYFRSSLGLGEAARGMREALEAAAVPVAAVSARAASGLLRPTELDTVPVGAAPFAVNVIHANADGLRGLVRRDAGAFLRGRCSFGVWWWEVDPAPDSWRKTSNLLDEVWVCSDYVLRLLAPTVGVPIRKVPQAVPAPRPSSASRLDLGFPAGFVFYFSFDFSSSAARKNPAGLILAFRRAFTEGEAHLLIRSTNGDRHRDDWRALQQLAAGRSDIRLIDGYLSPSDKDAALQQCDCYVSLHRAEGFGLPLAEALRLSRPVIATRWSGNLEFMTEENSYLVGCTTARVGPGAWPYPRSGIWAEPDIEDAVRLMRIVFENPSDASRRARRGADDLGREHDPQPVGRQLRGILEDAAPPPDWQDRT